MSVLARLLLGLVQCGLAAFLSVVVVYLSYRGFARANPDFDIEAQILRGNAAAALLISCLMAGSALILREAVYPVLATLTVGLGGGHSPSTLAACAAGHLLMGALLAAASAQTALRLSTRLSSRVLKPAEVRRGNLAAAFVLGSAVLVVASFARQGASSVSKSLIPQPRLGAFLDAR